MSPTMAMPALKAFTVDDFLAWDSGDDRRYELAGGVPVALAAASGAHQILAANLAHYLVGALQKRPPCNTRAEAPIPIPRRDDTCHVADLAVTCHPHARGERLIEEPVVVIEILSPSTENRDRKVKLPDYRSIRSVQEIVLLDQETLYCEVHRRLEDAPTSETGWLVDLLRRPDAILRLESIGFEAPLAAIYANVELTAVDEEI